MRNYSTVTPHYQRAAFLFASLLVIASLAVLPDLTIAAQSLEGPLVSIENFGKVNEHYYRGSQPGFSQFAELKRLGIKTIIDLRKDRIVESSGWARTAGLQYVNIPLTTKQPATEEQITYFFSLVNDPTKWPVYVHCKGGKHRTGEMTALYRITNEGWTAEQSYDEMKKYDFEDGFFYPRSLKKYVFSYYQQFVAKKRNSTSSSGASSN
jgi:protein tyrosine/serine phosphatase